MKRALVNATHIAAAVTRAEAHGLVGSGNEPPGWTLAIGSARVYADGRVIWKGREINELLPALTYEAVAAFVDRETEWM